MLRPRFRGCYTSSMAFTLTTLLALLALSTLGPAQRKPGWRIVGRVDDVPETRVWLDNRTCYTSRSASLR